MTDRGRAKRRWPYATLPGRAFAARELENLPAEKEWLLRISARAAILIASPNDGEPGHGKQGARPDAEVWRTFNRQATLTP